jgi:hypothetical protein
MCGKQVDGDHSRKVALRVEDKDAWRHRTSRREKSGLSHLSRRAGAALLRHVAAGQ